RPRTRAGASPATSRGSLGPAETRATPWVKVAGKHEGQAPRDRDLYTRPALSPPCDTTPGCYTFPTKYLGMTTAADLVLRHLPIECHTRPVKALGRLPFVPVGAEQRGEHAIALTRFLVVRPGVVRLPGPLPNMLRQRGAETFARQTVN